TCHWCHVMAHESFEDAGVAEILNRDFVPVKVDREERPDVDRVYMLFVQATTGQGGWPMSVWLTPDLEPFFGGTYFPPDARHGRPSFVDVLRQIAEAWEDSRDKVVASAQSLTTRLREATRPIGADPDPSGIVVAPREALAEGVAQYAQAFDRRLGGFGGAPKFPRPSELLFLLRHHALTGEDVALDMAAETMRAMSLGGMRDHVGGGFHRYAVDAQWRVPHFEKMLYDQAQLVLAALELGQAVRDPFYLSVAEDTLAYVRRSLTSPSGAFYSAEDADSVPDDEQHLAHPRRLEGAFYLWSLDEVEAAVGDDLAPLVVERFGLRPEGNAPDPTGEFRGRNVLYTAQELEQVARQSGQPLEAVIRGLRQARQLLFEARRRRPAPALDDKIVTAWNGLAIAAFARAGRVLRRQGTSAGTWLTMAERAAHFLRETLWDRGTNRLRRSWRDSAGLRELGIPLDPVNRVEHPLARLRV
ncbi:MAG: thioredoxin domain-containing protein, partial [Vicinamibacteria bacterium]